MTQKRFYIISFIIFFFLSVLLTFGYYYQKQLVVEQTKVQLEKEVTEINHMINAALIEKRHVLNGLEQYIRSTLDFKKAKSDIVYYEAYINHLDPVLMQLAYSFEDAYVIFLKEYFGIYHDRWYFDSNRDGIPEKMAELTESYYDGDEIKKAWYYKPLKEKKPVWIDPYESSAIPGTYFVTLTQPILYSGETAMLIGIDLEFNRFQDAIANYSDKVSQVYLLNADKNIIMHSEQNQLDSTLKQDQINFSKQVASRQMLKTASFQYNEQDGSKVLGYFNKLENGWYIGSTINLSEIGLETTTQMTYYVYLYLFALVLMITPHYIQYRGLVSQKPSFINTNQQSQTALNPQESQVTPLSLESELSKQKILQLSNQLIERDQQIALMNEALEHMTTQYAYKVTSLTLQAYLRQLEAPLYQLKCYDPSSVSELDFEKTKSAIDDALNLLSRAQYFSKHTEANEWSTMPLKHLTQETLEHLMMLNDQHSVQYEIDSPQEIFIHNNAFLVQQVFAYLVMNAFEHHFIGHQKNRIEIGLTKTAQFIVIDFKDDGIPFNAETINLALNPYFESQYYPMQMGLPLYALRLLIHHRLMGGIQAIPSSAMNHLRINIPL